MSLIHSIANAAKSYFKGDGRRSYPDPTPIEISPRFTRPISSLEDLRNQMMILSRAAEEAGNESFEEFYDFGDDQDFEDIDAPAQMKHDAVMAARDRDFEAEVLDAKEKYREKLNAEAREAILKELREKEGK